MGKKITYKKDPFEKRVMAEFEFLKLINIHIYNNNVCVINGNSYEFMSKLPKSMHTSARFKSLVGKDATLETIPKFSSKKQALEYLKEHYPDVINVSDKNLIADETTYYKTLGQLHPETGQVLIVYKSMYGFAAHNKISTSQMEKAVLSDNIVSGYKWKTFMEYDYPVTTNDYDYQDPLNKGFNFTMKVKGSGKGASNNTPVAKLDVNGNVIAKYINKTEACKLNNINPVTMTIILQKNKLHNNHYYKKI